VGKIIKGKIKRKITSIKGELQRQETLREEAGEDF